ncbi:MAG: efflux RND transporter periplasmic adaptor subunit [Phreatobacter sp.]|jgi:membrane fusion protein (multidrug efflux system)|uniref:efflux RND transporter periplasmic adaptor subunit n=1 Tax=Phreatobacter sp. TaxID=1966341 RepID=UPI0040375037
MFRRIAVSLAAGSLLPVFAAVSAGAQSPRPADTRSIAGREFDCLVEAHSRVKVSASVTGLIARFHVDRGDRVREGQVLVELDADVERALLDIARQRAANTQSIEAARAKLELAQAAADRLSRLRQSNPGVLTAAQYEQAIADARVAAFNLRDAELTREAAELEAARVAALLRQKRVLSPIDGVVVERNMSAGEHRHEQAHLMTLARIDPLHVEVFLPVAYFGQTAVGSTAQVTLQAPIGTTHTARVLVADTVFDAASGTFGVRLGLPNPDLRIPAGLRCRIRFE